MTGDFGNPELGVRFRAELLRLIQGKGRLWIASEEDVRAVVYEAARAAGLRIILEGEVGVGQDGELRLRRWGFTEQGFDKEVS